MTQQQQHPDDHPPQTEGERIRARKILVVETLNKKFSSDIWRDRLLKICGNDESRIMKALSSFLAYVMNDDGGKEKNGVKKYIADCAISTISSAFIEAFQMGIEVGGGRDHAYLVNYDGQCELEISYKGFVYALNKHFDNAFVDARCVFEGDHFECDISDTTASYKHKPKDPFTQTWDKLKGCYCYFSYTNRVDKQKVSRLIMIPKGTDAKTPDSLMMIRSKAKGSFAWVDFPFEQCKKATLRRAAKIPFASIDFVDDDINPEAVDNRHYQLESSGSGSDRLLKLMQAQQELMDDDKPKKDETVGDPDKPDAGTAGGDTPAPAPATGQADKAAASPGAAGGETVVQEARPQDTDNDAPPVSDISDADFEDVTDDGRPNPPAEAYDDHIPDATKMVSDDHIVEANKKVADHVGAATAMTASAWDGKTLFVGGKKQQKDFPTAGAACIYLKKIIAGRKHKKSRLGLIEENSALMGALVKEGQGSMIAELHKLAAQGE